MNKALSKYGIVVRHDMTYKLNTNIFNNIETEAQAYCLGCFYFHTNGRIQLGAHNIEILCIISKIIEYNGPIKVYNNIREINISQKDFLNTLNFDQNVLPNISQYLIQHFVRGIYDMYGSIYLVKNKYININIVQQENFLQCLRNWLKLNLDIDTKHYYRYSHTNTIQMMITRTNHAKIFLNWMYRDANYYLTRKFSKYQEYLKKGV